MNGGSLHLKNYRLVCLWLSNSYVSSKNASFSCSTPSFALVVRFPPDGIE
jgi:hypothetical protein